MSGRLSSARLAFAFSPKNRRLVVLSLALAYALCLLWSYLTVTSRAFGYEGYLNVHPAPGLLAFALVLALLPATWLPLEANRPSSVCAWLIYIVAYIPSQLVPYLNDSAISPLVVWSLGLLAAMWCLSAVIAKPPQATLFLRSSGWSLFWLVAILGITLGYLLTIGGGGLNVAAPDLAQTYLFRERFVARIAEEGAVSGYAIPWLGNIFNPILMSFGIVRRKPLVFVAGALGELLLFPVAGLKSILFLPLFILGMHVAQRRQGKSFGRNVLLGAIGIVTLAQFMYFRMHNDVLSYGVVRRVMTTPGLLSDLYVRFFSSHPKTLFADSFLNGLVTPHYKATTSHVIGAAFFLPNTGANANIFADGFAGFGVIGTIIVGGLFTGVALRLLDAAALGRDWRYLIGVASGIGFALSQSGLSTTIVTHGLALAWLFGLLIPARDGSSRIGGGTALSDAPIEPILGLLPSPTSPQPSTMWPAPAARTSHSTMGRVSGRGER
jgi:hypothetical protein